MAQAQALNIYPLKAFEDNYIWCIENEAAQGFIVVDPGDAQVVIDHAQTHEAKLVGILVTHHHFDHTGGIETLIEHFGKLPVFGPLNSPYKGITHCVSEKDTLDILALPFSVMEIPGHTLDHIAYYNAEHGILFSGDTVFLAGCGRIFEGTPSQMYGSLMKIMDLPGNTKVFPTHEYSLANLKFAKAVESDNKAIDQAILECQTKRSQNCATLPTTLQQEAAINPFLRVRHASVISSAKSYGHCDVNVESEVFSVLRQWKNNF